jgi:H+-transporting ATPase
MVFSGHMFDQDGRGSRGDLRSLRMETSLYSCRGANMNPCRTLGASALPYFAVFSVVSARERRAFWSTMPSKALLAALLADALTGTILTRVGLPGLLPLPWAQTLAIFGYALVSCLVVNDALKVLMVKWRVLTASV